MDRSRPVIPNFTDDETHVAINHKMLNCLGYINNYLYDVEPVKSKIEHQEVKTDTSWSFCSEECKNGNN